MIFLDINLNDFFEKYPELKEDCEEACQEIGADFNKIRPYKTNQSIGVVIDEDGLYTVSSVLDQSVFYN